MHLFFGSDGSAVYKKMFLTIPSIRCFPYSRAALYALGGAFALGALTLLFVFGVPAAQRGDWVVFDGAVRALAAGQSPYTVSGFYNVLWALLPALLILPFGTAFGYGVWMALNFILLVAVAVRLGARPAALALLLLSPPTLQMFVLANNEPMAYAGLLLPPPLGLFAFFIKPQATLGLIGWVAWQAYRVGRTRGLLKTFAPVVAALLLLVAVFGFWFKGGELTQAFWNVSPFPLLVPVGIGLMVLAIRKNDVRFALPVGICLSPYWAFYSFLAVGLALARSPRWLLVWFVVLWLLDLYGQMFGTIMLPR